MVNKTYYREVTLTVCRNDLYTVGLVTGFEDDVRSNVQQARSHGGHSGAVPLQILFVSPRMIQTRKINQFCKCLFSICLIVTPTRNITARCIKR